MTIVSIPTTEEDIIKVFSSEPKERLSKQNSLLEQLGIKASGKSPFMDYIHHLQKLNSLPVSDNIQPQLYQAIDSDARARRFLMSIV